MLSLLQSIPVPGPALHYGCQLWGMHTPTGEAKATPADLQSIYDRSPRRIYGVKHAPRAVLLEEMHAGFITSANLLVAADFRTLEHNCC